MSHRGARNTFVINILGERWRKICQWQEARLSFSPGLFMRTHARIWQTYHGQTLPFKSAIKVYFVLKNRLVATAVRHRVVNRFL